MDSEVHKMTDMQLATNMSVITNSYSCFLVSHFSHLLKAIARTFSTLARKPTLSPHSPHTLLPTTLMSPSSSSKLITFSSAVALLAVTVLTVFAPTVAAQDSQTITLSFRDESDAVVGEQVIPWAECTALVPGTEYAKVVSTEDQAALNLYGDAHCQIPLRSTVGWWSSVEPVVAVPAIRWEGTAPNDRVPGSLSTDVFPPKMFVQKPTSGPDAWVMDPAKGRIVVALVAGVLVIGVIIGAIQVYRAAQYKAPPKKPKKPKTGLNVKKIKKKDAYFRKPVQNDLQTFQRLHDESPALTPTAGRSARNSQYSEAATFVEWNQQQRNMNSKGRHDGADFVSVDIRETTNTRSSPFHGRSGSSTVNLIQFDSDIPPVHHSNHGNYNRGRGGEVLVPMHTFESNYQHPRSTVRRLSNSRSR